jgi:uncharacterized repeat protein (TIGR03803 family)
MPAKNAPAALKRRRAVVLILAPLVLGGVGGARQHAGGDFTTIHHFLSGIDGARPNASLIADGSGALYSTTSNGGTAKKGTAFKLVPTKAGYVIRIIHSFGLGTDGAFPFAPLMQDAAGALYGTTANGGANGFGAVFKLTPVGGRYTESVLYSFQGGGDGAQPVANLTADASGNLYSTTSNGGAHAFGTVFELAALGTGQYRESVLYSFKNGVDGAWPTAGLLPANGSFYGTTSGGGGASTNGTVFKLTLSGSTWQETIVHRFGSGSDGAHPDAALVADAAGNLYGTTATGGTLHSGTVFKLTPEGSTYAESVVYAFRGGHDGSEPVSNLVVDASGNLYGTTFQGGSLGGGIAFALVPHGSSYAETVLRDFGTRSRGSEPVAALLLRGRGDLYGTTNIGGATNNGTVFRLAPSGHGYEEILLHEFGSANDGAAPLAGLTQMSDGSFFGTTAGGGIANRGTVFELLPAGDDYVERVIHRFLGGSDGSTPYSGITPGPNGSLFGMTYSGGAANRGTVFELTPSRAGYDERVIHSFGPDPDGAGPWGDLLVDSAGDIFGTATGGGKHGHGLVFELTPAGSGYSEKILFSFFDGADGYEPLAGVVADASGALYGTTHTGGLKNKCTNQGCGTVFKLTPSSAGYRETTIYSLKGGDGARPVAPVLIDSSGNLYGTASAGGLYRKGTVFRLSPSSKGYVETTLHHFKGGDDGVAPNGTLIADASGALYGTTQAGDDSDSGTVFKLTPSGTTYVESILYAFLGKGDGLHPSSGLVRDAAGNLYGTTPQAGSPLNAGTVFKLAP